MSEAVPAMPCAPSTTEMAGAGKMSAAVEVPTAMEVTAAMEMASAVAATMPAPVSTAMAATVTAAARQSAAGKDEREQGSCHHKSGHWHLRRIFPQETNV